MAELGAHTPPKWEYRLVVKQTDRQMFLELNQFGREGWEAINLSYDKDLKGVMNWTCWLKRPLGVWSDSEGVAAASVTSMLNATASMPNSSEAPEAPKTETVAGFDLPEGDFELRD
jgi:hypothetical protein